MQNKCHFLLLNTLSFSPFSEGGNKIVVVIGFLYHYIEISERKAHKIDGHGGDGPMKSEIDDRTLLKGIKKKVEEEMSRKEIETILYWKGEMEKILAKRPESLGTFRMEIQNFIQRMQNRIKMLKSSIPS
jgi:hypothetical protein